MKLSNLKLNAITVAFLTSLAAGCSSSSGGGSDTGSFTYSTTSSKGDYSEWTLDGNNLTATWNVVTDLGTIAYSYDITATCTDEAADVTRVCTINTGSCTDGESVCTDTPSGDFDMMVVPGVAMFVHADGEFDDEQLHVGFAKDSNACADDVSGDYTFIRTGLGLDENFGSFRSDANFVDILHSEFGFDTSAFNITPDVIYRTDDGGAATFTDNGCVDGVRSRSVGGVAIRSMITSSGLFVLDLPAGQGGLLSFKTANAASLADFAGKNFGGISFPDNDVPQTLTVSSGALAANKVGFSATVGGANLNISVMKLDTADSMVDPAYPDFSVLPTGYDANTLAATYATPKDIPGLFKLDGLTDEGRVIMAAMKFNNKVISIGMVYNYRTTFDTNPADGATFDADGLYNTGNFILFEK